MKEYIVAVEDDVLAYEEYCVGYIRRQKKLIRCKDCKHRITANCERFGIKRYTQSDSFCSWAEPKDTTEEVRKQLKDMEQRREMDRKK